MLIDGEAYWDGSYAANPSLWPLHEGHADADVFLVELTPLRRSEMPTTAKNILNRINELASIHGLVAGLEEMAAIDASGRRLRLHVVSMPDEATALENEPSVKRTVGMALFEALRQSGRAACERWFSLHRAQIGVASSVDVEARYLAPYRRGPRGGVAP